MISGTMDPYWDPDRRCRAAASFLGSVDGNVIAGSFVSRCDPEAGIGYAYVTSQMGTALTGDPRDVAIRNALYSALDAYTRVSHPAC